MKSAQRGAGSFAAVDLGATSGRVMIGRVSRNEIAVRPVSRFPNEPVATDRSLRWNTVHILESVRIGLASALRADPHVESIGIDTWGVDYGLLRGRELTALPFHYRDPRSVAGQAVVLSEIGPSALFQRNGLSNLPINTLYQLASDRLAGRLEQVDRLLLIPDLISYWLTGRQASERTIASTTGLVGLDGLDWDWDLIRTLDLPRQLFPEVITPGQVLETLTQSFAASIGASASIHVTTVASHDTASAIHAIPSTSDDVAYISCGTWGLVGVEIDRPITTEEARRSEFTNELGATGRYLFQRNGMGMWILNEVIRELLSEDPTPGLPDLLAKASQVASYDRTIDVDDAGLTNSPSLLAGIARLCNAASIPVPVDTAQYVRLIVDSLAETFAQAVRDSQALSGKTVNAIHIVGGGSKNSLLCQGIADRTGLTVYSGPTEATVLGNIMSQAQARNLIGSETAARSHIRLAYPPQVFTPRLRWI